MTYDMSPSTLFSGLIFWGSKFFPKDLILSLDNIRQWAMSSGLIWNAESQLMASERTDGLISQFAPEDQLSICIDLSEDASGKLTYAEYPYLPVKSLIKRETPVEIVYFDMIPTVWDATGNIKGYGEVRFGFWYPGINDEFCSASTAKLIVPNFYTLYQESTDNIDKKQLPKGKLTAAVNGMIKAYFRKKGRHFDVEFERIAPFKAIISDIYQ